MRKYFGPGTLVAAAFIGPGTLTTCTLAGVQSSYTLLWAMLFSVLATLVLQEMAARLGFATRAGLGEALRKQFPVGLARYLVLFLVIGAILIGNAAYEAGNIAGGILGLELLVGKFPAWPLVLGLLSFALMYFGGYKWLERVLIGLVLLMSCCFLLTAILTRPNLSELMRGFIPSGQPDFLLAMGLIGTTVVPYNIFLHSATISKKWSPEASLRDIRIENAVAITLGGLVSMLIIVTAASSSRLVGEVTSAADLAVQLEPVFGSASKWLMGIGLMAAGLSSAITAPLAAAYAARGIFGWENRAEREPKFRIIWITILFIGVAVAATGGSPIIIIRFAQVANALLLPFIAIYLLYIANSSLMGNYTNGRWSNSLGLAVILITLLLSFKSLNGIFRIVEI